VSSLSRLLAYALRHDPGALGVTLDGAGWVQVEVLLAALAANGRTVDLAALERVVDGVGAGGKRRFELVDGRVRAAQGHSLPVDLGLAAEVPPAVLFHGTVGRCLAGIRADGLLPGSRRHVHLSATREEAAVVGARRGRPVVLTIDAAGMYADGAVFHVAANGVWLTEHVPAARIRQ
jgi:putative RNA 2'-phosphotransferase